MAYQKPPDPYLHLRELCQRPLPDPALVVDGVIRRLKIPSQYLPKVRPAIDALVRLEEPTFTNPTSLPSPEFYIERTGELDAFYNTKRRYYHNPTDHLELLELSIALILEPITSHFGPTSMFQGRVRDLISLEDFKRNADAIFWDCFKVQIWTGVNRVKLYGHNLPPDTLGPLLDPLLDLPVPISLGNRFSHTHIVGATDAGKTTLIKNLIAEDLKTNACIIVIEPHHQLIPDLAQLKLNRPVTLIDPRSSPGINIFELKAGDDPREVLARATKLLGYFFEEQSIDTTGKQTNALRHICRLMISRVPTHGPQTLMDLFEFLQAPSGYQADIQKLDPVSQAFFARFTKPTPEYRNTAGELGYRLDPILSDDALRPIFDSPTTSFDFSVELDKPNLILINADDSFLHDASAIYGKIFLSLILDAAKKRDPNTKNHPVYVYVDECHRFLDTQAEQLLNEARKFSVGCTFAHQNLIQAPDTAVRAALSGAGTKFAHPVAEDRTALASQMNVDPAYFRALPAFHWALHAKGQPTVTILPDADPLKSFPRGGKPHVPPAAQSPPRSAPTQDESFEW